MAPVTLTMSQCEPILELGDTINSDIMTFHGPPTPSIHPMFDYEVAELTWENGQLAMHGLGVARNTTCRPPSSKSAWDQQRESGSGSGTLECIVDAATCPAPPIIGAVELNPWLDRTPIAIAPTDTLVPCPRRKGAESSASEQGLDGFPERLIGSSKAVGSCSAATLENEQGASGSVRKRVRVAQAEPEITSTSGTCGRDSRHVTLDTCEMDLNVGFSSTSNSKHTTVDDHDSDYDSKPQRGEKGEGKMENSSTSTKRSRAAAIHSQSERKRRDKINQKMKTLQKLVPNSSKTDKASVLDEVIEYLKQLQAQVQIMSKMNSIPQVMMPMTMQQLQMSMIAQMRMGMGMAMGAMDMNSMGHLGATAPVPPIIHPTTLLPQTANWDTTIDRLPASNGGFLPDPFSTFLACQLMPQQQPQLPLTLDAYNRLVALNQQSRQATPPGGT